MLHTRLTALQTLVDFNRSSTQGDSRSAAESKGINAWLKSGEHKTACWHAERLLAAAENLLSSTQVDSRQKTKAPTGDQHEAPHVPFALYYATLVLYVKGAFGDSELLPSQIRVPILRGERVLSLLRAQIAKTLARVLREIGDLHIKH
ncbi:zinc-finger double domain-containing protein [Fusarium globosum]|uniref:Zinc-finger double domain-containing protein n=1 Tax=Fusarium globosum TaxID=78864 RepID=A0A8H5X8I8_9HYPO|nr:zinc-finger double domain-containing protein [Fusarium globosum]